METITKGIICHHFWRVMLYSSSAKFHINIIPIRWYKDNIANLNSTIESSPVLSAIESINTSIPSTTSSFHNNFTFQSLHYFQGVEHNEITHQNNSKRNRYGVAFSTAKTAVNIALETKSDEELINILKDFIAAKHDRQSEGVDVDENQLTGQDANNEIVPLQQHLIGQITNPNVTKIRGAPSKKRLKSAMELSKKRVLMQENTNESNNQSIKNQRNCLLCGKPGHYQKKCPSIWDRGSIYFCNYFIFFVTVKFHLERNLYLNSYCTNDYFNWYVSSIISCKCLIIKGCMKSCNANFNEEKLYKGA